ncbi:MAG TPA: SGNH/GDSL hydrolase family protein [Myxococcaceae bacterium]|jgi:lysophospholipase L1-like esterase
MRIALAWISLGVLAAGCSAWTRVAPDDPRLRYTGRVDRSDPAGPRFSNMGTAVAARVDSPSLRLHLGDVPYPRTDGKRELDRYEVVIDGAPAGSITAREPDGWHTVELGPGAHVVELFKRTEPEVGRGQLLGLELPWGGRLLEPPPAPTRRIEILGDSLTAGFGNLGGGPNCPFSAATEDGYRSYATIAGRQLRAEVHFVAWSGRGVIRNYAMDSIDTLPQLYERTLPEDPKSRWDFSRWTPDAVVIEAGGNDFGQPGLDAGAYQQGYFELVQQVRQRYPRAYILCVPPGVTDDWPKGERAGTRSREAMDQVMKRLAEAGVTRVGTLTLDRAAPEHGIGCAWHPSIPTHQAMAERLRAALSEALGWRE